MEILSLSDDIAVRTACYVQMMKLQIQSTFARKRLEDIANGQCGEPEKGLELSNAPSFYSGMPVFDLENPINLFKN